MRISSLIRRTLGLKGHRVERATEEGGRIVVELVANRRSRPICSSCGRKMPGYDTLKRRTWRHVWI
jgi:ribosomal protein L34E